MSGRYQQAYAAWSNAPEDFWLDAARALPWDKAPARALDASDAPFHHWFPDGEINACRAALDAHVEAGRGEATALVYDSPVTGAKARHTFAELRDWTARCAGALADLGVEKGDRVIIYMPMIPEAVVAMLACARLGAVHSVVFGGFAANELAKRIDDARPKVIISASCGVEPSRLVAYKPLLDEALRLAAHEPRACLIHQRKELAAEMVEGRDVDFSEAVAHALRAPCAPCKATDPLYILYTSGTTGEPKGVVRDIGGYCVALKWSMEAIYGANTGETFWAASDIGWVVGHSYIVYGPLLHGCATVLYEGKPVGTPDAGAFWRVIAEHGVSVLFTAPTAFRAIKREDPDGALLREHDISTLRTLFLAGERADPDTVQWAERMLAVPVIDHWWQTELGWPALSAFAGLDDVAVKHGSAGRPVPGYRFKVLDENALEVAAGENGAIVIALPLPPGCLPTLWNADERYRQGYLDPYPGYYLTGDAGHVDADGFVYVMGRTDDVINVAGHRLSTGAIEEVLAAHPAVAEAAVIGAADTLKGQLPVGFVVLKAGVTAAPADVAAELIAKVRAEIGPVAAFKSVAVVARLPKTRSGKILRATMRKIADGADAAAPAAIDDPAILDEIADALAEVGYGKSAGSDAG